MRIAGKGLKCGTNYSPTSSLATTLIGVDAPLPSIDLDKILTIVADTYDYTALVVDLLASWKRVLKPGGILGLGINIGERNGWETNEAMSGTPMFYHYFAVGELEEALEAAGYEVVEKAHITGKSNSAESRDFFVFAQRSDTSLDKTTYSQYVRYDEHEKRRTVPSEDLETVVAF